MNRETSTEHQVRAALLTGGGDRPYVFGLGTSLASNGAAFDLIGSDDLDFPELRGNPGVNFLNLRGNQNPNASFVSKISRVLWYYVRLICYAATAKPRIFHILWNNKFQLFDRTLLMFYYKLLGKRIVFTAHNVNAGIRDSKDGILNRLTLRIQYRLSDHLFVHTEKMKLELIEGFGVEASRITVIPFGINNSIPNTSLTPAEARKRLGIGESEKVILFFGNITPYKGLEYLVEAFQKKLGRPEEYRLIIAGVPGNCEKYWSEIKEAIRDDVQSRRILLRADFIPDEEAEIYFKAADVLVLPYRHIYQSGVLFTGFNFGLPALVADVGSLKDDIIEGKTGIVFRPEDSVDLAGAIDRYFASDLFKGLSSHRLGIRDFATERHSWDVVGQMTMSVYAGLLHMPLPGEPPRRSASTAPLNVKSPSRID
jgi:glycosyltransferase involved in cell wall biosynthesis